MKFTVAAGDAAATQRHPSSEQRCLIGRMITDEEKIKLRLSGVAVIRGL
jgi:hypothetical protein